jgi:hypothetical protein
MVGGRCAAEEEGVRGSEEEEEEDVATYEERQFEQRTVVPASLDVLASWDRPAPLDANGIPITLSRLHNAPGYGNAVLFDLFAAVGRAAGKEAVGPFSDLWGLTHAGDTYVAVCAINGIEILKVGADLSLSHHAFFPSVLAYTCSCRATADAFLCVRQPTGALSRWAVAQALQGNELLVDPVHQTPAGLLTISLATPASPSLSEDASAFDEAHNVFVDVETDHLFVVGVDHMRGADGEPRFRCEGGLEVYDLAQVRSGARLVDSLVLSQCRGDGGLTDAYVHDVKVRTRGGRRYALLSEFVEERVRVIDITTLTSPALPVLATLRAPHAHNADVFWTTEGHALLYATSECRGCPLYVSTYSGDFSRLHLADRMSPRVAGSSAAHSWFHDVHLRHDELTGSTSLWAAAYESGVLQFSLDGEGRAAQPLALGHFETVNDRVIANAGATLPSPMISGTWGIWPAEGLPFVAATDLNAGLFLLRPSTATPTFDATLALRATAKNGDSSSSSLSLSSSPTWLIVIAIVLGVLVVLQCLCLLVAVGGWRHAAGTTRALSLK